MGPALLLDKSGLQSLPGRLLHTLSRHYLLVVPPVLVREILGDLDKPKQGGQQWANMLSGKIGIAHSYINTDHRALAIGNLLGIDVVMDGRPVVEAQEFDTTGGRSALIMETEEHDQLLRCRLEKLNDRDQKTASEWRDAISSVDLEGAKARLKAINPSIPRVRSFTELQKAIDLMLQLGDQRLLLEMCMEDSHLAPDLRGDVTQRWQNTNAAALNIFAPYAFYCLRIRLLFHAALVNDLVSTRRSNMADLLYLYYVPFCKVFSSNDRLHEALAPLALNPGQNFITTSALRSDLEAITHFWNSLSESEQRLWRDHFGHWPPRNHGSFTYSVWRRTMRVPGVRRGNLAKDLSPEALRKLQAEFKEIQEQLKNSRVGRVSTTTWHHKPPH